MRKRIFLLTVVLLFAVSGQSHNDLPDSERSKQIDVSAIVDRTALISFAKKYLGTPYHYASSNPNKGFDCSGFVNFVFRNFKINLPRSSKEFKSMGEDLKPREFKIGDVVVFYGFKNKKRIGHVGIICEANGMKSKFIHSSSGKVRGIIISDLGSRMYARRFYRCVDVIDRR